MNFNSDSDILCAQVGPFQPSLQMQVKASPPPTHVPPFSQGPKSHVLFLAKNTRFYFLTKVLLVWQAHRACACDHSHNKFKLFDWKQQWLECSEHLTCVAGAASPARGAATQEGVSVVVTRASVAAGSGVALALTWTQETWYRIFFQTFDSEPVFSSD